MSDNKLTRNLDFSDIVHIIETARETAFAKVNEELIHLYWSIGEHLSVETENAAYGDGYIKRVADFIAENYPDIKGFNKRGLYRMKQFYETYRGDEKVSALLTQLSWTNHIKLLSACKSQEERLFYMQLAIKERYSSREMERQIDRGYYERYLLSDNAPQATLPAVYENAERVFLDKYVFEFLDIKEPYAERDLQKAIVRNLKDFVLEIGKDFSLIGDEYRVQVGNHDYYIDLLFFHRELSCLIAFELKIGEFKPEYVSKMGLYLETLDREVKKPTENPSAGIILCASKDDEVVEFTLSRNLSPTLISEYNLQLIDKALLQRKLKEFAERNGIDSEADDE
ncbi:PDDEXK nuclease domain-containing protein [Lachnospiraceae bacterium ZAX-1]